MTRAEIHARFLGVVARGTERAEREEEEHLALIRASGQRFHRRRDDLLSPEERRERARAGGQRKRRVASGIKSGKENEPRC